MTMNRAFLLTLPLLFVPPMVSVLGCHGSGTQAANSAPDASASAMPSGSASAARPSIRPFRHPGLAGLALNGSHDLQLTDEQIPAIEKLQEELSSGDGASRSNYQEFQTDVANGIRAGKFDHARLVADYAAFDKSREAEQEHEADALNGLHGVLTPEQRTALVAFVRTKQAAIDSQKLPEAPDGGVSDRTKQTLARMTQDLTLDPAQQKRVTDLLTKDERTTVMSFPAHKEEQKKHAEAFVSSFDQDSFDAKTLDAADAGTKGAHESMEREVTFLSQLTAILKPDQREKLAAGRTPHGPPMQMMHHPGPGGPGGLSGPMGAPMTSPMSPAPMAPPPAHP